MRIRTRLAIWSGLITFVCLVSTGAAVLWLHGRLALAQMDERLGAATVAVAGVLRHELDEGLPLEGAVRDIETITGQKAIVTKAKKSIAGFKLREGNSIGAKVTLRGDRMWEFFDRLISISIPRIRDFRGLNPKSFDGSGNYTFVLTEQLVFTEIDYDDIDQIDETHH